MKAFRLLASVTKPSLDFKSGRVGGGAESNRLSIHLSVPFSEPPKFCNEGGGLKPSEPPLTRALSQFMYSSAAYSPRAQ